MQTPPTHRQRSRPVPPGIALNLLASALTILTAIALLAAATMLGETSATVVAPERHDRVVHEFYRAVNEAIGSGDATALDRIVAADLVFHSPSPRIAPTRAGLQHLLASIHATVPAMRLSAAEVVSDGNRAVARVAGGSETPGGFLGLAFAAAPPTWGQFDSFRIENRQIVEMWFGAPAPLLLEPAAAVQLDLGAVPQAISFARLSARSGEPRVWGPLFGPRLLYVDEGTIAVDLSPTESPLIVSAGEAVSLPPESRAMIRHDATDSSVVAYTAALSRFHYVGPYRPPETIPTDNGIKKWADSGVLDAVLDGEPVFDPRAGVTAAMGRALLPPGANIAFQGADGYLLVVVETGAIVLAKERDAVSLDRIDPNSSELVELRQPFALHNLADETASVFLIAVLPGNLLATPAA